MVIGNGGREHAIVWTLAKSPSVSKIICVPGNGGTSLEDKSVNFSATTANDCLEIAQKEKCNMVVIGPENPLAEGYADLFLKNNIKVVGPVQNSAKLESSKDFAKSFMKKYGVASAHSQTFTDLTSAKAYLKDHEIPVVIKADGLAAGKGVTVATTREEAEKALESLMNGSLGEAGKSVVIEDYLSGTEVSILAAVSVTEESGANGKARILPFLPARDHKRLYDGAKGPNTGGMGAVCPVDDFTPEIREQFENTILRPTLNGLIAEKMDYRGFLFFGLMLTKDGPKCLEYNVRLGDPETQAVLPLLKTDFANLCTSICDGMLDTISLEWENGYQVAPVAVSGGYPAAYKKGIPIFFDNGLLHKSGAKVFVAGAISDRRSAKDVSPDASGLITNGGRVLACSAHGKTFTEAWENAYTALNSVKFEGIFYRKDIGLPGAAEST